MKKVTSEEWFGQVISRMPPATPNAGPHTCGGANEALLRKMASSRKPSFLDPEVARVLRCPRCQWRLYDMRERRRRKYAFWRSPGFRIAGGALAVVSILIVVTLFRSRAETHPPVLLSAQTIDLSTSADTRGGTSLSRLAVLPRARTTLTLVLPALSEEGDYTVSLTRTDKGRDPLLTERGQAVRRGAQTLLTVPLDMSPIEPGLYYLATSHRGDAIYYYPLEIKR